MKVGCLHIGPCHPSSLGAPSAWSSIWVHQLKQSDENLTKFSDPGHYGAVPLIYMYNTCIQNFPSFCSSLVERCWNMSVFMNDFIDGFSMPMFICPLMVCLHVSERGRSFTECSGWERSSGVQGLVAGWMQSWGLEAWFYDVNRCVKLTTESWSHRNDRNPIGVVPCIIWHLASELDLDGIPSCIDLHPGGHATVCRQRRRRFRINGTGWDGWAEKGPRMQESIHSWWRKTSTLLRVGGVGQDGQDGVTLLGIFRRAKSPQKHVQSLIKCHTLILAQSASPSTRTEPHALKSTKGARLLWESDNID